jgi:hypothetical protein
MIKPDQSPIADLNQLFNARHELQTATLMGSETIDQSGDVLFVEQVEGAKRHLVSLRALAADQEEHLKPAPYRAKGHIRICDLPEFMRICSQGGANELTYGSKALSVTQMIWPHHKIQDIARVVLNANDISGEAGHGDHMFSLAKREEPLGLKWLENSCGTSLPFQDFAEIVYKCGAVVVPEAQILPDIKDLAKKLDLKLAASLADLLLVCSGLELKGEIEETAIDNLNTGEARRTQSRTLRATVAVPTGFVIKWEPLPDFAAQILIQMTTRSYDGKAVFTLTALNVETQGQALADDLLAKLLSSADPADFAYIAQVPSL